MSIRTIAAAATLAATSFVAVPALAFPFGGGLTIDPLNTTLNAGESADFVFDFSLDGALVLDGFGLDCLDPTFCAGLDVMGAGTSVNFDLGSSLGLSDIRSLTFSGPVATSFVGQPAPALSIGASVDEVFLRVTAVGGTVNFSGASLAEGVTSTFDVTDDAFYNAKVVETTAVPLPASGLALIAGLAGLAGLRRMRKSG